MLNDQIDSLVRPQILKANNVSESNMDMSVVCGLHRSGTTFVGEILKKSGICVVHEPLNAQFGMLGVPIAYPFVEKRSDSFSALLDDALHLARPWNRDTSFLQSSGIRKHLYTLTGGRSGLRWGWLRFKRKIGVGRKHICLKDPFMSLATPYLVQEHALKVVCMMRHPAAIHQSTVKQGWDFKIENLRRQVSLVERYGQDIPLTHWQVAENSAAASIALLWKIQYRINEALSKKDNSLLIVRHEDLCLEPVRIARRICEHLGVTFTLTTELFVREHSEGENADGQEGKVHCFRRNSRSLVDAWRGRLNENDEAIMREIVGDDVVRCYGQW
jgi:hypothetical protein